jgi:hypothetical protein
MPRQDRPDLSRKSLIVVPQLLVLMPEDLDQFRRRAMSLQHLSRRGWRLAALLAVDACVREHDGSGPKDPTEPKGPKYEAQAWLRANQNPSPLASNRFGPKPSAVAFIDSLYRLGAETVYVVNVEEDSSWILQEGGMLNFAES